MKIPFFPPMGGRLFGAIPPPPFVVVGGLITLSSSLHPILFPLSPLFSITFSFARREDANFSPKGKRRGWRRGGAVIKDALTPSLLPSSRLRRSLRRSGKGQLLRTYTVDVYRAASLSFRAANFPTFPPARFHHGRKVSTKL